MRSKPEVSCFQLLQDFGTHTYGRLLAHLENYRRIPVLGFDEAAAMIFQRLRRSRLRIGTMDLKIAAIVLARDATLLSRNLDDFSHIPDVHVEDWTSSR